MKKYYKFGEMILALREEYKECSCMLNELKKCVNVKTDNKNFYFTGLLADDEKNSGVSLNDKKIILYIEKNYLNILKKIQYLRYDWYSHFLYSTFFEVTQNDNGLYGFKYDDILTPVDKKRYKPEIQIVDQVTFSKLIDELFSSDLMQLKKATFFTNHDFISLNFDNAFIGTTLGDKSFMGWNGTSDDFNYSINRRNSPSLIGDILSLEMPADKISLEWLNLLEKYENVFENEFSFDIDRNAQAKKGTLQISDIQEKGSRNIVKLLKK